MDKSKILYGGELGVGAAAEDPVGNEGGFGTRVVRSGQRVRVGI